MKTESVIKLPVMVTNGTIYDADEQLLCFLNCDDAAMTERQAHAIARALNTQPQLLEACRAALPPYKLAAVMGALECQVIAEQLMTAIAAAEKEKV